MNVLRLNFGLLSNEFACIDYSNFVDARQRRFLVEVS